MVFAKFGIILISFEAKTIS